MIIRTNFFFASREMFDRRAPLWRTAVSRRLPPFAPRRIERQRDELHVSLRLDAQGVVASEGAQDRLFQGNSLVVAAGSAHRVDEYPARVGRVDERLPDKSHVTSKERFNLIPARTAGQARG